MYAYRIVNIRIVHCELFSGEGGWEERGERLGWWGQIVSKGRDNALLHIKQSLKFSIYFSLQNIGHVTHMNR